MEASKLTIFIDGNPVSMTLEQAKKFYNELNAFFISDNEQREFEKDLRNLRDQGLGVQNGNLAKPFFGTASDNFKLQDVYRHKVVK